MIHCPQALCHDHSAAGHDCAVVQVQQAREQSSGAEVSSLRSRLEQAESAAEALRARANENDTLRAKLTDLEASAQHAWQWQEAYSQLQRQLHDVQVCCLPQTGLARRPPGSLAGCQPTCPAWAMPLRLIIDY